MLLRRTVSALLMVIFLTGCASTPPKIKYVVKPEETKTVQISESNTLTHKEFYLKAAELNAKINSSELKYYLKNISTDLDSIKKSEDRSFLSSSAKTGFAGGAMANIGILGLNWLLWAPLIVKMSGNSNDGLLILAMLVTIPAGLFLGGVLGSSVARTNFEERETRPEISESLCRLANEYNTTLDLLKQTSPNIEDKSLFFFLQEKDAYTGFEFDTYAIELRNKIISNINDSAVTSQLLGEIEQTSKLTHKPYNEINKESRNAGLKSAGIAFAISGAGAWAVGSSSSKRAMLAPWLAVTLPFTVLGYKKSSSKHREIYQQNLTDEKVEGLKNIASVYNKILLEEYQAKNYLNK